MRDMLDKLWGDEPPTPEEIKKFNPFFYTSFFSCRTSDLAKMNEIQKYMFIIGKERYFELMSNVIDERGFINYYLKKGR